MDPGKRVYNRVNGNIPRLPKWKLHWKLIVLFVSLFQASKLEFHKFHSETLQFRNVNPAKDPTIANTDDSNAPPKEAVNSLVQENDHELGKANEKIPAEEEQKCSSTIRWAKTSLVFFQLVNFV